MNGGCITTFCGRRIDPLAAGVGDIELVDIAHALALTCRFKGHCRVFYSVAEHSVRVSRALEARGASAGLVIAGLMHDAAEAYLSDVGGPIKGRFFVMRRETGARGEVESFGDAEERLLGVIAEALGFPRIDYEEVRWADMALLATEARDLFGIDAHAWGVGEAALEERIEPWEWQRAERAFLERFAELRARQG
ncbi:MAG TPA: phosphohydrolase [Phycisphaerae bacterium]|nr:phosphohydrolase [Phycisphaerae bacterium]